MVFRLPNACIIRDIRIVQAKLGDMTGTINYGKKFEIKFIDRYIEQKLT